MQLASLWTSISIADYNYAMEDCRSVLDENLKRQRVTLDENLKRQRVTWSASQNRVDVKNEKLRKHHLELVIARVMRAQAAAAAA